MVNARAKGARGEREFCKWLYDELELEDMPVRNLEQVRSGGHDVYLPPFMFEVKRVEKLNKQQWWLQVVKASEKEEGSIPIVCFRQNKTKWNFLISAKYIGLTAGFIQLEETVASKWMNSIRY